MPRIALNQIQVYETDRYMNELYDRAWRYNNWTHTFHGSQITLQKEAVLTTLQDAQRYVDKLLVIPGVRALREGPVPMIEVKQSQYADAGHAHHMGDSISIIKDGPVYRELHVLHELAHCLCSVSGHGDKYREVYISLIEIACGPETAMVYRSQLHEYTSDRDRYTNRS